MTGQRFACMASGNNSELDLGDLELADFHIFSAGDAAAEETIVRQISIADVLDALRHGYRDFLEKPSHYIFVVLIYPIIGVGMFRRLAAMRCSSFFR